MSPVYVLYAFICYLSLALLIPADGYPALVSLDAWYAVKMHALGNEEKRVISCSKWPECANCRQECLVESAE